MVAEAASEREDERGDGEAVGRRVWRGVPEGDRDGGREFKSGAMLVFYLTSSFEVEDLNVGYS